MPEIDTKALTQLIHLRLAVAGKRGAKPAVLKDLNVFRPKQVTASAWKAAVQRAVDASTEAGAIAPTKSALAVTVAAGKEAMRWAGVKDKAASWETLCHSNLAAKGLKLKTVGSSSAELCAALIGATNRKSNDPIKIMSERLWAHLATLTQRDLKIEEKRIILHETDPIVQWLLKDLTRHTGKKEVSFTQALVCLACDAAGITPRTETSLLAEALRRVCFSAPSTAQRLNAPKVKRERVSAAKGSAVSQSNRAATPSSRAVATQTVQPTNTVAPPTQSLETFAARVHVAAGQTYTGRVGTDKVLISHVAKKLGETAPQALQSFKKRLLEANQRGLLRLGRADLANTLSPQDVHESEITYLTATFHCIRLSPKVST